MNAEEIIKMFEAIENILNVREQDKTSWKDSIRINASLGTEHEKLLNAIKALAELGFITVGFKPVTFLGGLRGFILNTHHLVSHDLIIAMDCAEEDEKTAMGGCGPHTGGEVQEHGGEYVRPLTWEERYALKRKLEEGCSDFIPYKGKGRFKEVFRKIAQEAIKIWLPALVIAVIAVVLATGIVLATFKIFNI
jgi:hypothetical protein